ncbi:MAG: xylulokinase [Acidobacteria bacterium]|nr:xylulokinase [Acidobacteriota bacterium]
MPEYFLGIDAGTQSTKTLAVDAETGAVAASATAIYGLLPDLPPGHKEQHPQTWLDAADKTIREVVAKLRGPVRGIGVSGQQHGFVPLDERGQVIRPAKLWNDTSTAAECDQIMAAVGGRDRFIALTGNALPPGFTASKILWLKKHEPANFARLATVLLPHDYLNFWLTGIKRMEYGDASGTALMDVRTRAWSRPVLQAIDTALESKLPPLDHSAMPHGPLRAELARQWGLGDGEVLVSSGGGDNMMGAIGTGNVASGVVTVSLGTSGTIYACSDTPVVDPKGEVAAFCDSTGKWLPLVCTMNVTVATEMVRDCFGMDHGALGEAAARVSAGSDGLLLIPFFEGERTPNCPQGTGVFFGVRPAVFDAPHLARAAMEGVTLGLNYGLNRMRELGLRPREIRATGGGAKNAVWRQIVADVFNAPVVCLNQEEGAAYGAALQAMWSWENARGPAADILEITQRFLRPVEATRAVPAAEHVARYQQLQALFNRLVEDLASAFAQHRDKVLVG